MKKQDFKEVMRGDPREEIIYISGNYSAHRLVFVTKADKVLTSDRLIEKKNTAAGGDDDEITASYANGKTKITVKLLKDDTQDFTQDTYYYDLTAQIADQSTDPVTLAYGELQLIEDVQTDYDNTDLPADGQRYIPVLVPSAVTQAAVEDAIAKKHAHTNASVLNATQESFTTALKTDYDDAVTKEHTHSNKSTLDTYTQTEVDLASAVSMKHSHDNKSVLDLVAQSHLDFIAREDALYNYLFGGVLDENSTLLSFDENNMILQIDEGVK